MISYTILVINLEVHTPSNIKKYFFLSKSLKIIVLKKNLFYSIGHSMICILCFLKQV